MRIDSIIDFAQVITEAERYRPAAEKSSRASLTRLSTTIIPARAASLPQACGKVRWASGR